MGNLNFVNVFCDISPLIISIYADCKSPPANKLADDNRWQMSAVGRAQVS